MLSLSPIWAASLAVSFARGRSLRRRTALRDRPRDSPISLSVKDGTGRKIKMLCACSGRPSKALTQ